MSDDYTNPSVQPYWRPGVWHWSRGCVKRHPGADPDACPICARDDEQREAS